MSSACYLTSIPSNLSWRPPFLYDEESSEPRTFHLLQVTLAQDRFEQSRIQANSFPLAMVIDIVINPIDALLLEAAHDPFPSWQPRAIIFWEASLDMFCPFLEESVPLLAAIEKNSSSLDALLENLPFQL